MKLEKRNGVWYNVPHETKPPFAMMMSRTNEKWLPQIAGMFVALIWLVLNWSACCPALEWFVDRDHPHLLLGTVTFGSIMAGFTSISVSALSAQPELMNAIKKSSHYDLLVGYITEFICSALTFAITSLIFLFILNMPPSISASKMFQIIVSGTWLGVMIWTSGCLIRVILILTGIIKNR